MNLPFEHSSGRYSRAKLLGQLQHSPQVVVSRRKWPTASTGVPLAMTTRAPSGTTDRPSLPRALEAMQDDRFLGRPRGRPRGQRRWRLTVVQATGLLDGLVSNLLGLEESESRGPSGPVAGSGRGPISSRSWSQQPPQQPPLLRPRTPGSS